MNTTETIAIALVVLAFITYRQTRWVSVKLGKLLRMPVIFVIAGLLQIPSTSQQLPAGWHLGGLDVLLIAVELVLALMVGWLMGRRTEIASVDGVVSSRLGGAGVAVWLGFVAIRVGLAFAGAALHAPLPNLPVVIFFVVAAIKITQAIVVRERVARHLGQRSQLGHSAASTELTSTSPASERL
jgi:hypothetical protein